MRIALAAGLLLLGSDLAVAHIHLTSPLARTDSLTGDQKDQHCGVLGQVRNPARVTTFAPGQTINVTWMETIQHPGYFRIAIQPDGDIFGIPPPDGASGFPTVNQEGVDPNNNSIVLADRIPDGMLSFTVTLPNIECDNCTLQFIQVMTDKPPYTTAANSDDIYFNCADITLAAGGTPPDGGPTTTPDAPGGGGGGGGGEDLGGGCSSGGSSGAPAALLLVAGLFVARRRRAR